MAPPTNAPEARRITPPNQHCFFGYYDVPATDPGTTLHLMHRVPFRDRLPTAADVAEIGFIRMTAPETFVPCGTTRAWNFQQGSALQWLGDGSGRIFHNDIDPAGGGYRGVLLDPKTGTRQYTDGALANLSPDGRWGIGINFDRLYDFRPGYGYAFRRDPWSGVAHPADDGIRLCDLRTGRSELVLSLEAIHRVVGPLAPAMNGKLLVNHITFNPSATRFVFLVRDFPAPDAPDKPGGRWYTAVLTAARDGSDVRVLGRPSYASHYHWRDDATLVFHANGPQGWQLYEITDAAPPVFTAIDPDYFRRDGHCSYAPDRRTLLYDGYVDEAGRQPLYRYDLAARRGREIGAFAALPVSVVDLRCDLHPRWLSNTRVSFDSTHEGFRGTYLIDLD